MKYFFVGLICIMLGYHIGFNKGLYNGAKQLQNCLWNGGTGWYIDGKSVNCIF